MITDVAVMGDFDQIQSGHVRFLERASKSGVVHVLLWSDELVHRLYGTYPEFPQKERAYFLESIRYVSRLTLVDQITSPDQLPQAAGFNPGIWAVPEKDVTRGKKVFCAANAVQCKVISQEEMEGFPPLPSDIDKQSDRKKVVVTGTFDWLHSGHVRFFEETSALGDLYVVVGHDGNIRLLKGDGHPMFSQEERSYMVQSIRYVKRTLISSGSGWLDAEPELLKIQPHVYAVNQEGDKPEKQDFCLKNGIEYKVLQRTPKPGLRPRESTQLRGF